MVRSFGGALEIIGVRAVIQDVQKYLNDSKRIENANENITKASDRLAAASRKSAESQTNAIARVTSAVRNADRANISSANAVTAARNSLAVATRNVLTAEADLRVKSLAAAAANASPITNTETIRKAAAAANAETAARATLVRAKDTETAATIRLTNAERQLIATSQVGIATVNNVKLAQSNAITAARTREANANKALQASEAKGIAAAGAGKAALVGGAAIIGAFVTAAAVTATVSAGAKYETQLTKIDNLTNLTSADTKKMGDEILKMTKGLPQTPEELGAGAYFILSSGIQSVDKAQKILELSAKASTIGLGSTEEVARTVTAVVNAYGEENINAAQATDILVAAIKEGSAEAPAFAQGIGRLLNIGRNLGVEFDQLAAAVAGLTNVGLPADQAITALLGIMTQLFSPSQEAREMLKGVGTSIEAVRVNIREKGLLPALQDLLDLFGGNVQAIEKLFPEVRGLGGALALLRDNGRDNVRILNNVQNSVGITEKAFQKAKSTLSVTAGILKNNLNRELIALGTKILPYITAGMNFLNKNTGILGFAFKAMGAVITTVFKAIQISILMTVSLINGMIAALNLALIPINGLISAYNLLPGKDAGKIEKIGSISVDFSLDKAGESVDNFANQNLKNLEQQFLDTGVGADEVDKAANKAAEALKKVAEEFKSTGEAAADVESYTKAIGLNGEVSRELAEAFGLDAMGAGAVQGFDAVIRQIERANNEGFNFARTLSTVAVAFEHSADVANEIVLGLARRALESTRSAVSALFGRPTREVAGLNLQKAQIDLQVLQIEHALRPQIDAFEDQLKNLNEVTKNRVDDLKDNISNLRDSEKQRIDVIDDQIDELQDAERRRVAALDESIEKLKDRLRGQNALQELIEEEMKSLSDLLEFADFKDFIGIPELTPAEQAVAQNLLDDLEEESEALQATTRFSNQQLIAQERERDALKTASAEQIETLREQKEAIERSTDAQVRSIEKQIDSIEKQSEAQEKAIEAQIASIEGQIKKYEDQAKEIDHQIALYRGNADILQRQIDVADNTLETEETLRVKAEDLRKQMEFNSQAVYDLTQAVGVDLIPEITDSIEQFNLLKSLLIVLNDPTIRSNLIPTIDYAAVRAGILAAAEWEASDGASGFASAAVKAAIDMANGVADANRRSREASEKFATDLQNHLELLARQGASGFGASGQSGLGGGGGGGEAWAEGGIVRKQSFGTVAEGNRMEAVLPLTNIPRSREIIAQIPPYILSAIMSRGSGSSSGGGSMTMNVDNVTIMDPRRDTGPVGDMGYSLVHAMKSRGANF